MAGAAGLIPSVDWLFHSALLKEALVTSQIEGTQATLTALFDDEAGQVIANPSDVEEVTNYQSAFRPVREKLRSIAGLPKSVTWFSRNTRPKNILFEHLSTIFATMRRWKAWMTPSAARGWCGITASS